MIFATASAKDFAFVFRIFGMPYPEKCSIVPYRGLAKIRREDAVPAPITVNVEVVLADVGVVDL